MPTGAHFQRLEPSDYELIRRMWSKGISRRQIAAVVGCSVMHVGRVLRDAVPAARSISRDTPPAAQR